MRSAIFLATIIAVLEAPEVFLQLNDVQAAWGTVVQPGYRKLEPTLQKSGKWYILLRSSDGTENAVQPAGSPIYLCPWCGNNLADWPKADTKESLSG